MSCFCLSVPLPITSTAAIAKPLAAHQCVYDAGEDKAIRRAIRAQPLDRTSSKHIDVTVSQLAVSICEIHARSGTDRNDQLYLTIVMD